jgi:hypothetical protein
MRSPCLLQGIGRPHVLVDFAGIYPSLALESPDRREDLVTFRYVSLLPSLPAFSSSMIIGFLDHRSFELRRVYGFHCIPVGEGIWISPAGSKGNEIFSFRLLPESKTKDKAAPSSTILRRDLDGSPFQEKWDYRRIIGKLNFLEKSTRPEIAYALHQFARFASNPRESHANAIKYLCRYLLGTKDKGIILRPDVTKSFEVLVDCDFAGNRPKRSLWSNSQARSLWVSTRTF